MFGDLVVFGQVVKPHGLRGELVVEPTTDVAERFDELRVAWVPAADGSAREVAVTSCFPHKGRFVLKLAGVDSIDAAQGLRGTPLGVPQQALPDGAYYHHQLRGLAAVAAGDGRALGKVADILETGAGAPVIVVRDERGQELLLAFTEHMVEAVDLANGRLVVRVEQEAVPC